MNEEVSSGFNESFMLLLEYVAFTNAVYKLELKYCNTVSDMFLC